jgi:phosphomannomutase
VLQPQIFKANDIRGIVGPQWDAAGAYALGLAYAELVDWPRIVVGRDMRVTSPMIHDTVIQALRDRGKTVVDIGLASTDEVWFAAGWLDLPAIQVTSSHNPSQYNGLKFCSPAAKPVTSDFLTRLAGRATELDTGQVPQPTARGAREQLDVLGTYTDYLLSLVDLSRMRPLKVVVDAGNGMGGHTAPQVLSHLDVEVIGLYLDLDGTFPHHQPNPLEPKNVEDACAAVREHGADLGIVFDGDADRVFMVDERGEIIPPSAIAAMIAVHELAREPGATIVVNTITSSAVKEIVEEAGGTVVQSKVGHTYMKALMASEGAIFGGEHSAHYYFRDFYGADTGMLAALHVLAGLSACDLPVSQLVAGYTRYAASGEINSVVTDPTATMNRVSIALGGVDVGGGDGVKLLGDQWWVSLRPSNTEPLLRLNVEARDPADMARLRDTVLDLVKED